MFEYAERNHYNFFSFPHRTMKPSIVNDQMIEEVSSSDYSNSKMIEIPHVRPNIDKFRRLIHLVNLQIEETFVP